MWVPARLNNGTSASYGLGWVLDEVKGHKRVHHGGSLPGFRSEFARFTDDKLSVVVLTNSDNANPNSIALGVASIYISGLIS